MTAIRKWSLLTALACAAVLAAGWLLLVSPQQGDADLLRADALSAQEATARLRTQLTMLKTQAEGLPAQQARLTEIAARLPDNPALPPLVRALTAAAEKTGVTLVSLAPAVPTLVPAPPAAAVVAAPVPAGEAAPVESAPPVPPALPLAVLPLKLEVVGDYYGLEAFIAELESLQRSFLVSGFSIAPGAAPVAAPVAAVASAAAAPAVGPTGGYDGSLKLTLDGRVFLSPPTAANPAQQPVVAAAPTPAS